MGAFTKLHFFRITAAAAAYSSTVSPRVLSVIKKPPVWEGVDAPAMIISKAVSASERVSDRSVAISMRSCIFALITRPWLKLKNF